MAIKYLTSSSLSTFRDCPRRYYYAFELQRAPVSVSDAISFGSLFHKAMEAWWQNGMEASVELLKKMATENEIKPEDAAKISAILKFYDAPKDKYNILGIETTFETKIRNPKGGQSFYGYRLQGKADVLLQHKDTGEIWICDHKTTTKEIFGFGTYWQILQIDGQMNNYCLSYGARGFIYDVVRRPTIKMCGKDEKEAKERGITTEDAYQNRIESDILEEPSKYYQWREYTKTDDDMNEARLDLWQQVEMFHSCNKDGRFPRNCNSCVSFYGNCPYIPVCIGQASIDDDALYRTKEAQHEEI